MTQLRFTAEAVDDLERLAAFLRGKSPPAAAAAARRIADALRLLKDHPLAGRQVESDLRELVILKRRTGYLALYRYDERSDVVLVLRIRHMREAGYPG